MPLVGRTVAGPQREEATWIERGLVDGDGFRGSAHRTTLDHLLQVVGEAGSRWRLSRVPRARRTRYQRRIFSTLPMASAPWTEAPR